MRLRFWANQVRRIFPKGCTEITGLIWLAHRLKGLPLSTPSQSSPSCLSRKSHMFSGFFRGERGRSRKTIQRAGSTHGPPMRIKSRTIGEEGQELRGGTKWTGRTRRRMRTWTKSSSDENEKCRCKDGWDYQCNEHDEYGCRGTWKTTRRQGWWMQNAEKTRNAKCGASKECKMRSWGVFNQLISGDVWWRSLQLTAFHPIDHLRTSAWCRQEDPNASRNPRPFPRSENALRMKNRSAKLILLEQADINAVEEECQYTCSRNGVRPKPGSDRQDEEFQILLERSIRRRSRELCLIWSIAHITKYPVYTKLCHVLLGNRAYWCCWN